MGHTTPYTSAVHGHGVWIDQPSSLPSSTPPAQPNKQPLAQLAPAAPLLRVTQSPCAGELYPQRLL